ncbi:GATA transcription factor 6-like [Phragmites australis]|uniref:GATA transcription factor 6-like n=1 Tax=Phragmites australis TaxID=29695 RepID=UPI002D76967A|nr:GATA transcription factor 6-like [Phragmites australis]
MASFVAHHHGSLVEREGRMAALRSSLRPYEAAEEMAAAAAAGPAAWGAVDRGVGLFGEGFSVEDLLDLEDLCEVDKDGAEQGEAAPKPAAAVEEDKSSDSHGSSVVSYELMPPPPPVIDLPLPAHDAEELEWVSRIMDESLSELPPPPQPQPQLPAAPFAARRSLERVLSATDPMRSPTICALSTEALVPVKAKRSKRSRASVWSLSGAAPLSDSTSSSSTTTTSSCSSSASFSPFLLLPDSSPFMAAHFLDEAPRPKKLKHGKNGKSKPKKRGRKPKHHPPPQFAGGATSLPVPGDRRCSHCGVQKTPQWRAGPEGAKTLCNACGVRYKSGRLLPEYRPACSPTFVSSIHSNSHRKVLEMRRKKEDVPVPVPDAAAAVASF